MVEKIKDTQRECHGLEDCYINLTDATAFSFSPPRYHTHQSPVRNAIFSLALRFIYSLHMHDLPPTCYLLAICEEIGTTLCLYRSHVVDVPSTKRVPLTFSLRGSNTFQIPEGSREEDPIYIESLCSVDL